MALTKDHLIESIRNHCGLRKNQSIQVAETLLEIVKSTLESDKDVLISGFGKFCVKEKDERKGRNPATGSEITLPAKKVVTFRYAERLRNRVNGLE